MTGAGDFENKNFEELLVEAATGQWALSIGDLGANFNRVFNPCLGNDRSPHQHSKTNPLVGC